MAGIFISHSSKDKPFVTRLAVDLALEGLPVWLDSWELAVGDSLERRISTGIEGSSFLVLVVSPASVHSKWVQEELRMGLVLESRVQRPFVLPVRIESADLPEPIAGRIFLDFGPSYRAALERLVRFIKEHGGELASIALSGRLIPLSFSKEVYLKEGPFTAAVAPFVETGATIAERQFLLAHDSIYNCLRDALLMRLENIASDAAYSYALEKALETTYRTVLDFEQGLIRGIALIVNHLPRPGIPASLVAHSCHIFAKLVRSEILGLLYDCQRPDQPAIPERAPEWLVCTLEERIRCLLGIDSVKPVDIGLKVIVADEFVNRPGDFIEGFRESFPIYIDTASTEYQDLHEWPAFAIYSVQGAFRTETITDFLVPQMVFRAAITRDVEPVWDFHEMYVGQN